MGRFNVDLLPDAFAACPLCGEDSLEIKRTEKGETYLVCSECESSWVDLSPTGMRLVIGPAEHIGRKSMGEWAAINGIDFSPSFLTGKIINETECTCGACGNVWYYGKTEATAVALDQMQNAGKSLMCLGGCLPSLLIPDRKPVDLNKCPKCGSRAITKEVVSHAVD